MARIDRVGVWVEQTTSRKNNGQRNNTPQKQRVFNKNQKAVFLALEHVTRFCENQKEARCLTAREPNNSPELMCVLCKGRFCFACFCPFCLASFLPPPAYHHTLCPMGTHTRGEPHRADRLTLVSLASAPALFASHGLLLRYGVAADDVGI